MSKTANIVFAAVAALAAATGQEAGAKAVSGVVPGDDFASRIYLGSIPSVSPDGTFFVFEWCDRIWRAPVVGGEAVPLGDGRSRDVYPFLSPDGKRVTFLSDRDGGWKLFELALEAGDGLAAGGLRQVSFHSEGVSPKGYTADGSHMLAVIDRDDAPDAKAVFHGTGRAALLPLSRRGREKIFFDAPAFDPALSPDGKRLLFLPRADSSTPTYRKRRSGVRTPGAGRICLYDLDAKTFTTVIDGRSDVRAPLWTPDGKGFYYMSDQENAVRNVFLYSFEARSSRRITAFTGDHVFAPALSADGKTMILRQGFDFWRLDPTAAEISPERIVLRPAGVAPSADRTRRRWYDRLWNNDAGGYVAFTDGGKEVAFTTGGDLWVMDASFRQPVCVHGSSRSHERACGFSPDGSTLYYLSDRGDGVDVWKAVRADPSKAWWENTDFIRRRLTTDDVYREDLELSPDGSRLAWKNRTGKIFFADTNAVVSAVSQVKASGCSSFAWSPDSRWVAASIGDAYGNHDVWIVPAFDRDEAGNPAPAPVNLSRNYRWDGHPAWSPDGKIVAFAGRRAKTSDQLTVFYVYLDPADEAAEDPSEKEIDEAREKTSREKKTEKKEGDDPEKDGERKADREKKTDAEKKADAEKKTDVKKKEASGKKVKIVFEGLFERVRMTEVKGSSLFFGHDPRKLGFESKDGLFSVTIPKDMKPAKLASKKGPVASWCKNGKDEKLLRIVDGRPAVGDKMLAFKVHQETSVADYQELAFLSAWATVRDCFCDPGFHGADWPAVREKYRLAARHAPSWSVFSRVLQMMLAELNASHQGFWESDASKKEWNVRRNGHAWDVVTAHFGARYDRTFTGEGWKVASVVRGSPVDRGKEGLRPGDVVLRVDGRKVSSGMDVTDVMNVPLPHTFRVDYVRNGTNGVLFAKGVAYGKIRDLMRAEAVLAARRFVAGRGNYGYINIEAMNAGSLDDFMDSVFAEGFGKDGLIVDVRYNGGGHTADKILDVLCGPDHSRAVFRGDAGEGYLMSYWGRPLLPSLPLVVLCNWKSASNAEIFSHAVKTLKRGKLVGTPTAGGVIATRNCPLLDIGTLRRAYIGWFTADGTDMEEGGAVPDIEVDITTEDILHGRDPQLDAAIRVLAEEAAAGRKRPPLKYLK